eukprot:203363-Amphidinium_carterae.1
MRSGQIPHMKPFSDLLALAWVSFLFCFCFILSFDSVGGCSHLQRAELESACRSERTAVSKESTSHRCPNIMKAIGSSAIQDLSAWVDLHLLVCEFHSRCPDDLNQTFNSERCLQLETLVALTQH